MPWRGGWGVSVGVSLFVGLVGCTVPPSPGLTEMTEASPPDTATPHVEATIQAVVAVAVQATMAAATQTTAAQATSATASTPTVGSYFGSEAHARNETAMQDEIAEIQATMRALGPVAPLNPPASLPVVPRQCYDADLRYPESLDPEGAVQQATQAIFRRQGWNPYSPSPVMGRLRLLYQVPPEETFAGWVMVSLYDSHYRQYRAPTLEEYVELQAIFRQRLPNSMLAARYAIAPMLSTYEWSQMTDWPSDSCDGVFMRNPYNRRLVRLMTASVGDTSWMNRTPSGAVATPTISAAPKPVATATRVPTVRLR